jgi:maleylacetoacetate isomerase
MMRFHGYFRSSSSYRCRIAFNLKGIAYEFAPVHLLNDGGEQKAPGYRALNPQGLVPTLEYDGLVLGQSLAILEWLDETHPEPPLLPKSADERAQVRAFSQIIACDIHPLQNLRILQYLKAEFGQDQVGVDKWCQRWIGDGLGACEEILSQQQTRNRFCFGNEPGLADICLVPQVFSAERFGVDLTAMPRIRGIHAACSELSAFSDAHPSKQPDAA